jgi:opacity protein-like surface antigen
VSDQTDRLDSGGRTGKFLGGFDWGRFAVEGGLARNGMLLANSAKTLDPYGDMYQLSVSGKISFPLGDMFEAYGRAGLHHTKVDNSDRTDLPGNPAPPEVSGNGFLIGGGFEYKLNLGIARGASIFVDYQISKAKLEGGNFMFDATMRVWTLGLTIGL